MSGLASSPEPYFTLFGFVFVRKADLLAATAFLLAAGSAFYQLGGYWLGPHVALYAPDRIIFMFDRYPDGRVVTRVLGQPAFTNTGQVGRNATIKETKVRLSMAGLDKDQYWVSFPRVSRTNLELNIEAVDEAHPVLVAGANTTSMMTGFAPRNRDCSAEPNCDELRDYVDSMQFLHALQENIGKKVELTFSATTFEKVSVAPAKCLIDVTQTFLTIMAANDWFSARCIPST